MSKNLVFGKLCADTGVITAQTMNFIYSLHPIGDNRRPYYVTIRHKDDPMRCYCTLWSNKPLYFDYDHSAKRWCDELDIQSITSLRNPLNVISDSFVKKAQPDEKEKAEYYVKMLTPTVFIAATDDKGIPVFTIECNQIDGQWYIVNDTNRKYLEYDKHFGHEFTPMEVLQGESFDNPREAYKHFIKTFSNAIDWNKPTTVSCIQSDFIVMTSGVHAQDSFEGTVIKCNADNSTYRLGEFSSHWNKSSFVPVNVSMMQNHRLNI